MMKTLTKFKPNLLLIFFLVLMVIPLFVKDQYVLQVIIMAMYFAYLASCWNIVGGFAGLFSLGHAAFIGLGAYGSTILFLQYNISPWLGMFFGGFLAVIAAVIIGYPCFKLRGVYFAISTLAFVSILQMVFTATRNIGNIELGAGEGLVIPVMDQSFWMFQFFDKKYYYWIILCMLILITVVVNKIRHTHLGYFLLAIHQEQDAADSLGVNVRKYKLLSWCISAFFTALGGTFYAQLLLIVSPERLLSVPMSIELVIMSLIGGIGTIAGPILGAFLLVPLGEVLRAQFGGQFAQIQAIVYGAIIIAVIIFLPTGLKPQLEKGLQKFMSIFRLGLKEQQ